MVLVYQTVFLISLHLGISQPKYYISLHNTCAVK